MREVRPARTRLVWPRMKFRIGIVNYYGNIKILRGVVCSSRVFPTNDSLIIWMFKVKKSISEMVQYMKGLVFPSTKAVETHCFSCLLGV